MDTKLLDYRTELMERVKVQVVDCGEGQNTAFIKTITNDLLGSRFINDPVVFYWKGESERRGQILLFGYDFDESDRSFSLFACDYIDQEEPHNLTLSTINTLSLQALRFVQECLDPKKAKSFKTKMENEAADFFDILQNERNNELGINKVKVFIFSNGFLSNRVNRIPIPDVIPTVDSEVQVWDIRWLYENIFLINEPDSVDVDLSDYSEIVPDGIHCLKIPQQDENYDCYLASMPGLLLSVLYRRYGSQLLEGNVRSFLTTKTSVNKQIQRTINNNPSKFFIFNNGIATTAKQIDVEMDANGYSGKIKSLNGLQIINGGQTTASLAYASQKSKLDISAIDVQMKLTILHVDQSERAQDIATISKSSNSQNKVTDADFFTNHEFHIVMERLSKSMTVPPALGIPYTTFWYYERVKGQYLQETLFKSPSEKKQFYDRRPKSQKITKEEFAKYNCILEGDTVSINKGASASFAALTKSVEAAWEDERKKAKYNELYFKKIANVALLYRTMETNMTKKKQGDWVGSYRANMIYFTLVEFFKLIRSQFPNYQFNNEYLWDKNELSTQLLELLIDMAKVVYKTITDPNRPVENVTQWCKGAICSGVVHEAFKTYQIPFDVVAPYLMQLSSYLESSKNAKINQSTINEVEVLSRVCNEPYFSNWYNLQIFIDKNPRLFKNTDRELRALKKMIDLSLKKQVVPSVEECKISLKIWDDAKAFGWKEKTKVTI